MENICVVCGKAYPERPSQISKGSRRICFACELGERKVQGASLESIRETKRILDRSKTEKKVNSIAYRNLHGIDGIRRNL